MKDVLFDFFLIKIIREIINFNLNCLKLASKHTSKSEKRHTRVCD